MSKKWQSTFRVGIYTCHMTYTQRGGLYCVWSPELPLKKSLSGSQYRAGRDALIAEVTKEVGDAALVIET